MKNTTRRNLLAKLGVGAAAAVVVAGTSNTAKAGKVKQQLAEAKPLDPKRVVKMPVKSNKLQVAVRLDGKKGGFVLDARPATKKASLGLSKDSKVLNLGVSVGKGSISIAGLDAVVNRVEGSGRCWLEADDVEVSL